MTDKQTIIDGCDVAGCEYLGLYKECKLKCGSCCPVDCSDNPNCYYKQLKRKEQECEELKKELQAQRDFTAHEQKLIYCVAYDETCKTGNDCKQEKCIFKDNIKLKQTLTEIKEIAENGIDDKEIMAVQIMLNGSPDPKNKVLKQILQKINEVNNDR